MKLYTCTNCYEYSLTNIDSCPFCGLSEWEEIDQSDMSDGDWGELMESAGSDESAFVIAQAWADTGSPYGMLVLGNLYEDGTGCQQDDAKTFEWWSKAADKKNPLAIGSVGLMYTTGSGVEQDVAKGLSMLWKASELKDDTAPYFLGKFYKDGLFVAQNEKKAMKLFKIAAERGNPDGMFSYATALAKRGKNMDDIEVALSWLWRAARMDHPESQLALGSLLDGDLEPIADIDQSKYWLHRAAVNECEGAASILAENWLDEDASDEEIQEMFELLQDALERGDYSAAVTLGDIYREGAIVEKDFERAYKYYRQGQGANALCSARVARCYRYGEGVGKNTVLAFKICKELFDENDKNDGVPVMAVLELADMYENGVGTPQNRSESVRLYSMLLNAGNPCAMGRMGQFVLEDHPFVKAEKEEGVKLLISASEAGDFDSMLYLVKYYLSIGDRESAESFMEEALVFGSIEDDDRAADLAKAQFPDLWDDWEVIYSDEDDDVDYDCDCIDCGCGFDDDEDYEDDDVDADTVAEDNEGDGGVD